MSRSGRSRADVELSWPVFIVTGTTDKEFEEAETAIRRQIAFYGSTPAYRGVLEVHGWDDLHRDLNTLSKSGRWDAMNELISDEVIEAFAVRGRPGELRQEVHLRYGDVVDRVALYAPYRREPEHWVDVVQALREPPLRPLTSGFASSL